MREGVQPWFEALRPICKEACAGVEMPFGVDVLVFYLARWCQKQAKNAEPDLDAPAGGDAREAAARIAVNLAEDGERVERLFAGDVPTWTELHRLLLASAAMRSPATAREAADEALQKIAEVLLTGTPPSRVAERLQEGPEGPPNEYIFLSPFSFWAKKIVINLMVDEHRRGARRHREAPAGRPKGPVGRAHPPPPDPRVLRQARDALPGLVARIRVLPPRQRSVMVLSLCRETVHETVRDKLHELAPDLFSADREAFATDREIAERLGISTRLVAANRSVARRKLAKEDARWALLMDVLLPHRSTRPIDVDPAKRSHTLARGRDSNG